jgi:hypothetical protein
MEDYVRNKQSESLKTTGQMERLENVSAESALDLLCEKNQWSTCLERTKANEDLHAKYLAKYVTHLVKTRTPQDAIKAYVEHGAPMNKVHFSLYKALATLLFYDVQYDEFETWRDFRDIMYNVVRVSVKILQYVISKERWIPFCFNVSLGERASVVRGRSEIKSLHSHGKPIVDYAFLCL